MAIDLGRKDDSVASAAIELEVTPYDIQADRAAAQSKVCSFSGGRCVDQSDCCG